jgi:hypothetical protein
LSFGVLAHDFNHRDEPADAVKELAYQGLTRPSQSGTTIGILKPIFSAD